MAALLSASLGLVLPDEVSGWRADGPAARYGPETIFDYIDGHGEVYLAYGMRSCTARRYEGPEGEAGILADLFEMGSAEDAWGVFSHGREGAPAEVGEEGALGEGTLSFRKGSAYVFLTAERPTARSREALVALARVVAGRLPPGERRPRLVDLLPEDGLERESVVWLRDAQILAAHVPVEPGNPLGVGPKAPAALGRYRRGGISAWLVVVEHPTERAARAALERVRALPAGSGPAPDGGFRGISTVRGSPRVTALVLGATSRAIVEPILGEAGSGKGGTR